MKAKAKKDTTKVVPQQVLPTRSKSIPKSKKIIETKQESPIENRATRSKKSPAASKARRSKSVIIAAESEESEEGPNESDVVFKQDSFVAYISKEAVESGEQDMTIGKIVENTTATDKEVIVIPFTATTKLAYTCQTKEPVTIKDYQVICSVDIATQTAKKVTITKKAATEISKLINNIFDSVREKINLESDEEAEKEVESESESESAEPQPRKYIRAIRGQPPQTQVVKQSKKVVKSEDSEDEPPKVAQKLKIGSKRPFPEHLNSASSQPNRKMKKLTAEGASVNIAVDGTKKAKATKAQVLKIGKWNPDTVLVGVHEETERYGTTDNLIHNCCLRCNCRNLVRAVETNNQRLLKACLQAKDTIPDVGLPWSLDAPSLTPLELIVSRGDLALFETFFKIPNTKATDGQYEYQQAAYAYFRSDRATVREPLLTRIDTGKVSYKAYGSAVRSVQMTRGNRQGNQAFIQPTQSNSDPVNEFISNENFKKFMTPKLFKAYSLITRTTQEPIQFFQQFALSGNIEMLEWIIEPQLKNENYGFNKLHLDVLKLTKLTEKYHTASITKKAANTSVTPLHLACLNPNKAVLQVLLDQNNDINVLDTQNNKPIHYAAVCSQPSSITLLLEKGANVFDVNTTKKTPLHFAALNSRPLNVKAILENNLLAFKYRDKSNKTAFCYALEIGDIETIKSFIEYSQGKIKINTGQGLDRMTPLMYAAATGRYDLAEYLLANKGRVLSKDKYKRTALIMAVRNGHTRLASLLLQHGSDWKHVDSSSNTPLHYAAASGFIECIDLLLKHGADLNAMNSWKVTPITIAMLNNHQGTVKRLLKEPNVDVNGKDDQGRTLLSMAMLNLEEPQVVEFAAYLIEKGADVNMGDVNKRTPLHILAAYIVGMSNKKDNKQRLAHQKAIKKTLSDMIDLILEKGGNLALKTESGQTPFEVALDCDNIDVLNKFSKSVKLSESPQILHKFQTKIFDERFRSIFVQLIEQEKDISPEIMNHLDAIGMSPFLQYVNQFVDNLRQGSFANRIRTLLIWNSHKHALNRNKYIITNELLFDTTSIDDELQIARDRYQMSHDQIETTVKSYIYQLFTLPFIELLKFMISKGADPLMKVGKTKFYRELDEHKRHLALVGESRDVISAVNMQINTMQKKENVKTRTEVLAERTLDKKGKKGKKDKNTKIDTLLKDFYAKKNHSAQYMKVNGKNVEIEYNKEYGMQNAIHLLFKHPSQTLFDFFADSLHIPIDETDYMGRNPFMINTAAFPTRQEFFKTMETLLKRNIRFDLPDTNGRTPFLIFYENHNFKLANKLLDLGANIKQMDVGGLFAAKYALIRRQDDEIRRLMTLGADINQIDNKGRNLLHHAVNMSSATADATFETEQCLIDLGVNINQKDHQGRVPLHYAFVKIKAPFESHQLDPIETVSSLCGQPGLEIEVADRWLKTPLHYAAQRGAAICTLYMIQRGAALESKDIYGNTAVGISLLRKHFNYAILLIQKTADVCLPIYDEYPNRIAKKWEEEAKAKKRAENVDMESDEDNDEEMKVDTGKDLFKQKVKKSMWQQYGSEEEDDKSEEESEEESAHEQNVFNNQNAFGMQMFQNRSRRAMKATRFGAFGQPMYAAVAKAEPQKKEVEKELPPKSAFRISIQNQQQGIAYLILDSKYDYMLAMQDALDEKKFNLVLTLLSKTADNRVVQRKNDLNQNLMHILAKNSSGGLMHILKRIYDQLKKRGVNCLEQDNLGNNALHYAVDCGCYDLCQILIQERINVNAINNEGFSPLTILMKGERGSSMLLKDMGLEKSNLMFQLLATSGADVNAKYPEESYGEKDYKCTIMINIVRRCAVDIDRLRNNLHCLLSFNGSLETVDSKGRDVMMHSIMQNNIDLVKFFISNAQGSFFRNHKDTEGKNAIHYIVNPHDFGSFENVKILEVIHKSNLGYDLALKDNFGKTPLDYANQQKSGVLANELTKIGGASTQPTSKLTKFDSLKSYLPIEHWPAQQNNFEQDSHDLLTQAEAQRVKELMEEKKDSYVPLDVGFGGEKQYKVYFDGEGENRRAYDAYMTKVDLKNGFYGDYTFYKMQMVYDSNRELYIVLTRYGRIGEEGMNQRTPFISVDDAKKEFHTIFKQKSANEWDHAVFVKAPKKYVLVKVNYSNVQHKDYLAPFDYENCPLTRMDKQLRNLIEEISNVTMYQRSMSNMQIDLSQLPVSSLTKETINTAKEHLHKLGAMIQKLQEIRKAQHGKSRVNGELDEDFIVMAQIHQDLADLTSAFYQTIPMKETDYWDVRPIREPSELQALYAKMDCLTQIEFSCRLLLGALYKQKQINPVDYVYDCIQTQFRIMQQGEPEFELIKQFIVNTSEGSMKDKKFNLFKISRKGEGERYEKFQQLQNRRLLFHGTAMTNMLGILSQGLRIAPPEAPTTGYMFGKGLYFADLFRKSAGYSHGGHQTQVMLLCEVALGHYLELYKQTYIESLPSTYNSVKAIGQYGGNYPNKTIVTPEGFQVPLGGQIKSQEPTEAQFKKTLKFDKDYDPNNVYQGWNQYYNQYAKRFNWPLQMNEYIVYNVDQVKVRYLIQWQ